MRVLHLGRSAAGAGSIHGAAGLVVAAVLASCGPKEVAPPKPAEVSKIATTERGPRGARLVLLSEQGVRLRELTRSQPVPTLDSNPSWSPDGRWLAFARASGDDLASARLHLIRAFPNKLAGESAAPPPRELRLPKGRHKHPRWFPDSASIVFASDASGSFDLYRLALEEDEDGNLRAAGEPTRLTRDLGDELSPTVSPDGKSVAFMSLSADGKNSRIQLIELQNQPPQVRTLTKGPLDVTPAFNPEEPDQLAFARRADARNDLDLFLVSVTTGEETPLPAEPIADLTGPVWSIDGRHLFATAVFRALKTGEAILSSVVVLDRFASEPVWRALHDPAFTESRVGVALAPRALLPSLIDTNRPYQAALKLALEQHLIRNEKQ